MVWISFSVHKKNGIPLYPFHFNNGVSSIKFSASHYGIIHGLHCTYAYSWKGPGLVVIENCLLSMDTPPKDGLPHVEVWLPVPSILLAGFCLCWLFGVVEGWQKFTLLYSKWVLILLNADITLHWYSVLMWTTCSNFLLLWS